MARGAIQVDKCLKRLMEKYNLDAACLKRITDLKQFSITSIAFTTDGGFDETTGNFHCEERRINFKIRIKFKKAEDLPEEFLVLKPVQNTTHYGGAERNIRYKKENPEKKALRRNKSLL